MKSDPHGPHRDLTGSDSHRSAREQKHISYGLVYMNECVWKIREMKQKDPEGAANAY